MLQWLAGDATDPEDAVLMHILSLILLGNEAAPLKKALIESKLGADLIYSGAGSIGLESNFRVGLKGSEPDRIDAFARLVSDYPLRSRQRPRLNRRWWEAAFQQASYHYLEIGIDVSFRNDGPGTLTLDLRRGSHEIPADGGTSVNLQTPI